MLVAPPHTYNSTNQSPHPPKQVVQIAAAPAVIGGGDGPIKVSSEAAKPPASGAGSTKSPNKAAGGRVGSPVVSATAAAAGYVTEGGKDIKAKYEIDPREIGHGHYGVVRKARYVRWCTVLWCVGFVWVGWVDGWVGTDARVRQIYFDRSRETGEMFAIKTIRKSKVSRLDSLRREIDILQTVDHPQIIKVRGMRLWGGRWDVRGSAPIHPRPDLTTPTIILPHLTQLVDVYEDDKFLHLVTELCTGGEVSAPFLLAYPCIHTCMNALTHPDQN